MTRPAYTNLPQSFIAISIIEDNEFLRVAWREMLDKVDDFVVLGDFASCEDALDAAVTGQSDIILMDIGLPGMTGIEGLAEIGVRYPDAAVVMITVHDDNQSVYEAICAGAVGYLLKSTSPEALQQAIRDAHAGGSPMTPNIARKIVTTFQNQRRDRKKSDVNLTEQEERVLSLLAEGKSYSRIAEEMFLSVHGVRYHLRHIYQKLQVKTRSEAVARGLRQRLIKPPF